jgi:hypothetical protein
MLTKDDVKIISDLMDKKFDNFAIIVKNALDSKPDREELEDMENRLLKEWTHLKINSIYFLSE